MATKRRGAKIPAVLRGIWLNPGHVETAIEPLLLRMLGPTQPDPILREAALEEFHRRVKRKEVLLRYLGLQEHGVDTQQEPVLHLVSMAREDDPWREALLMQGGDCPIGFVVNTYDYGKIVLIHTVFQQFTPAQQDIVRAYAAHAVRGQFHDRIVRELGQAGYADRVIDIMQEARRRVQGLDSSVLFSPDGGLRVQVGSLSQTTKNILREGIKGDYLFILPKYLFEGKTNYADVEFMIYLNFFVRQGMRTRIAGTARQRNALEHLLRLTIFGLFSPGETTVPPFDVLQKRYSIPDAETYALFTMLYDKYSVRQGFQPSGPILGMEAYLDFVLLHDDGRTTLIDSYQQGQQRLPSPYSVQVALSKHGHGAFEVTITQPDGHTITKVLEVNRPTRLRKAIPGDLSQAIRFATHRPRFGITPLGTSHGFDLDGDLTSFVIWLNSRGILVDPSPEALDYLEEIGIAPSDLPYVFLTHVHADHDGGLIEKLLGGSRTAILASDVVFRLFIEKAKLVTGHDFQSEGLVEHVPTNPGQAVMLDMAGAWISLTTRWNLHPIPTNGFILTVGGHAFGYSGDTQYDPGMLDQLRQDHKLTATQYDNLRYFFWTPDGAPKVDLLYHEAGIPPIHTDKNRLAALPEAVKARTFLVHVADRDVPPGFVPHKPTLFATQVLLPATAQSRTQTLLHTLSLVSYLYDAPPEVLEHLLGLAIVRVFERDTQIIQAGQVPRGTALYFYVVADGQVAVMDNGRLVARLIKSNSFGEWGISHQRGFRIADVVACQATQVLEFSEQAYYWMVEAHPPIQRRIGQIRDLLPKLLIVRTRAQQKSAQDPLRIRSVIEDMHSGQLSAFAVFSEIKRFQRWDRVIVEGDEADGFYILLSGHLIVSVESKNVGELSEADVFGEVGVLEGRRRTATVEVASADAEILFMSLQNFHTLLYQVPAFSFGVRAMAAGYGGPAAKKAQD